MSASQQDMFQYNGRGEWLCGCRRKGGHPFIWKYIGISVVNRLVGLFEIIPNEVRE